MATGGLQAPLAIAPDHPAFEGHFPGRPIVPAVVLVAETLAAIEAAAPRPPRGWKIAAAKFSRPVGPGIALTLTHEETEGGGRRFEIRCAEGVVATGSLAPA